MPGIKVGVGCSGGATRAGGRRQRELIGWVAPVVDGRREVVGKMREGEAELLEGLD